MTPKRKRRLAVIVFVIFGATIAVALLLSALGSNMNHYYELSIAKADSTLIGKTIRIGGIVEKDSIQRQSGTLNVTFGITNLKENIEVQYHGILPDLFREGQGVLAKGSLVDQDHFIATEILAKHDENYMPKAVQAELEKNGYTSPTESNKTSSDIYSPKATLD